MLNLGNISQIYRRGWLARELEISVAELLLLIQYSALDPFSAPDPSTTPPGEPPVVRFVSLVQAMSAASLAPRAGPLPDLEPGHQRDLRAGREPISMRFASTLRGDFAAVDAQFVLKDDPTGAIAKSLMTLVYGTTATNFFFGLLNTLTVSVSYGGTVPPAVLAASSGRLTYDDLAKELTYAGLLDTATMTALQAAAAGNAALLTALASLQTANQAAVGPFFAQYPELLRTVQCIRGFHRHRAEQTHGPSGQSAAALGSKA